MKILNIDKMEFPIDVRVVDAVLKDGVLYEVPERVCVLASLRNGYLYYSRNLDDLVQYPIYKAIYQPLSSLPDDMADGEQIIVDRFPEILSVFLAKGLLREHSLQPTDLWCRVPTMRGMNSLNEVEYVDNIPPEYARVFSTDFKDILA